MEPGTTTWLQVRWNARNYPRAVLRDAQSRRVISIARSGEIRIPMPPSAALAIEFSDGVRGREERVELP